MVRIHPRRPIIYIEKQHYVLIKSKCRLCYIRLSFEKSAEVSFMLSGMPSTKQQWKSIRKFARLIS